jgi:hypothetical protein
MRRGGLLCPKKGFSVVAHRTAHGWALGAAKRRGAKGIVSLQEYSLEFSDHIAGIAAPEL